MQVVSYRPKILQQGDYSTDYLSEIFLKTFKGKLSFQNMSSSRVFFTKIEDHSYVSNLIFSMIIWRAMSTNIFSSEIL